MKANEQQTITFSIISGVTRSYKRAFFILKKTKTPKVTSIHYHPRAFATKERAEAALTVWSEQF